MNYLAHAYLSNNNNEILVGNFIADHISGNNFNHYSEGIKQGIFLHRQIDAFTDNHPHFKEAKRFFYDGYEKYSGILIDIYFDYFLAKHFAIYSSIPLPNFCNNVYSVYNAYENVLPKSSANFLNYVLQNNIYVAYSTLEGIEKVLYHLSHRIKHGVMLNNSITLFNANEAELKQHFDIFFNDINNQFILNPSKNY
jgi:acyl carrier protein phosphodiesterase